MPAIEDDAIKIGQTLWEFQANNILADDLFRTPDSVTYVASNPDEFRQKFQVANEKRLYEHQDGRFAALMRTGGKISIGSWGLVEWLELIEPLEGESALGWAGVQRVNFHFPEVDTAKTMLALKGVPFIATEGMLRNEVSVLYNTLGHQFALVDTPAQEVLQIQ